MDILVYDGLGKEIDIIANNKIFLRGSHQISWNAEDNPSGVYFIKFYDGLDIRIEKTLLLKWQPILILLNTVFSLFLFY